MTNEAGSSPGRRTGVVVAGACGRMGQEVVRTILAQPDMHLAAAVDVVHVGEDAGDVAGSGRCDVTVTTRLEDVLSSPEIDVLVDFTRAEEAVRNVLAALEAGKRVVVGTTGISAEALGRLRECAESRGGSVLIAPNFALGAVLMMRFATEAARYYEWAEIVERHHEQKIDAPSGTALRTAELMSEERKRAGGHFRGVAGEVEKLAGSRGGSVDGIRVHAVRMPGLLAHQEVVLGGPGETLLIRHDSTSRASFMPGVMLAIRRISRVEGLVVGLEHLL